MYATSPNKTNNNPTQFLHTTNPTPPHHPPKLNFHHKEPQINLCCCLNNNINIKDNNNNKNNIINDNNNKNNNNNTHTQNKTTSKQLGCDLIVISLVFFILCFVYVSILFNNACTNQLLILLILHRSLCLLLDPWYCPLCTVSHVFHLPLSFPSLPTPCLCQCS